MKKAELERYAVPTLPKSRRDAVYHAQSVRYILRSGYAPDRKTLIVAFFDREAAANGFPLPVGILYLRKGEYLTKTIENGETKWRECRIKRTMEMGYREENVCLTQMDRKRILDFLKRWSDTPKHYEEKKDEPIHDLLEKFQTGILAQRLKKKKARRAAEVDHRMKEVPNRLPKSFDSWVDAVPLLPSRYIYYKRIKRTVAKCFCIHCQREFLLKRKETDQFPAHNKEGCCPYCGSAAVFKAAGITKSFEDSENAALIQYTKKGEVVIRFLSLWRSFEKPCSPPRTGYHENVRLFLSLTGEITGEYKNGYSVKTGRYGWYAVEDRLVGKIDEVDFTLQYGIYLAGTNLWFEKRYLFPANLHTILKRLNLSFDLKRVFRAGKVDVTSYLLRSFKYPFAPSLYRIGLEQVGRDLLVEYFDPVPRVTSGPLHKQLGVSKKALDWARERGWGRKELDFMTKLHDMAIQKDEVQWFVEKEIPIETLQAIHRFATYHRIIRYLTEQGEKLKQHFSYSSEHRAIRQWKDYLEMCEKLGYDRRQDRVLFPHDLRNEHDKVSQLIQIQKNAEADRKIQELYPALERQYYYQEEKYFIRPPKDFEEFIKEGTALVHCVCTNGYYRGHIAGERLIFFVRDAETPDCPLCTMEYDVQQKKVIQLQGYCNQAAPPEVQKFVERWRKQLCQKELRKQAA